MPARSVVLLLLAAALVAGAIALSRCARAHGPARLPIQPPPSHADTAERSTDAILVRARVLLLTRAGAVTPEGASLLAIARRAAGGVIAPDQRAAFDADLATLAAAGQASLVSSPAAMIPSGQQASIEVGQVGTAPAWALHLELDLLAVALAGGAVHGTYTLRAWQQTGAVEVKLAELGLPVGDRAIIGLIAAAASGHTLLGLRELPASSDLGAAIIVLIVPQIVPTATAPAPQAAVAGPARAPAQPGGAAVEHDD
ncbi:MAG: hypothetical protein KJZ65_00470 [Phycisphaerales bacterium]|nr:hypothetical protein [Phycisphaerales bacterium]